jgi:O-antigen/teichoic acid export membrane protein
MNGLFRLDAVSRPTMWLVFGRGLGFAAAFIVPIVLVRLFDQTTFGTYKQLFLIFGTLYGLTQIGVAESLYYFVPKRPGEAGRYASNAVLTLTAVGVACTVVLGFAAPTVSQWLKNPQLVSTLVPVGVFLTLMLMSAAFEIVLTARQEYKTAASAYAVSDLTRAIFILVPALVVGSLQGVLWGLIAFAAARFVAMVWWFARHNDTRFAPSLQLWRSQWAYTLPFALAVSIEVLQGNLHQYLVASRFDPATFAIYAVGCLQIPLVDVVSTSGANVLMVKMGEDGFDNRSPAALSLWHDTVSRLASVIVPLMVFLLVMARDIIVTLFTANYLASVPVFMLWTLTMLSYVLCVDGMLRVHAQTRFLFGLNVLRLALVLGCTSWCLSLFGLPGAVLVVLGSTWVVRVAGMVRLSRLMGASVGTVLPWSRLGVTGAAALVAALPVVWFAGTSGLARPVVLIVSAAIYSLLYAALSFLMDREPAPAVETVLQDQSL